MTDETAALREALKAAKQKLTVYYLQTNAQYGGGQPYNQLMEQIDAALKFAPIQEKGADPEIAPRAALDASGGPR